MPIKLLHHKSYHVYNSKNIERVRRDEREAKEKQQEIQRQADKQERINRTELLRQRAGISAKHDQQQDERPKSIVDTLIGSKVREKAKNESTADDQFVMRLDKPADELQPWYTDRDFVSGREREASIRGGAKYERSKRRTERSKTSMDPLLLVNSFVELTKQKEEEVIQGDKRIKERSTTERDSRHRRRHSSKYHGSNKGRKP